MPTRMRAREWRLLGFSAMPRLPLLAVAALVSLAALLGMWAALTDIWHQAGRPDFWAGEGAAAYEWRWLSLLFWPVLAFHLAVLGIAVAGLRRRRG